MGWRTYYAGIEAGVYDYDVAQAGLGGCPYAPGAPGNLRASQVAAFLADQDIETSLDVTRLKALDASFDKAVREGQPLTTV